jgi:hypothetical protein
MRAPDANLGAEVVSRDVGGAATGLADLEFG